MPRGGRGGRSGRAAGGGGAARRHPQSGKQKKEYLKAKKAEREARKEHELVEEERERLAAMAAAQHASTPDHSAADAGCDQLGAAAGERADLAAPEALTARSNADNKLTSLFLREDRDAVEERRQAGGRPLDLAKRGRPLTAAQTVNLGFPSRPDWDAAMTPAELDALEHRAFAEWKQSIWERFSPDQVSPFEHNLEVWRQLWRACEKSTVVLVVADVRNPLLHLPMALHDYVRGVLRVPLVICLTKIDLVDPQHVSDWRSYLERMFPGVRIVTFSTRVKSTEGKGWNVRGGASARRKIISAKATQADERLVHEQTQAVLDVCIQVSRDSAGHEDLPTIGIVGQPNVGKSSLVNALMGEKVVSVSRTCGHTKHWQTHVLERDGEPVARLVDSPGLIFATAWNHSDDAHESVSPRHVFECSGLYPIPQIRETYSAIRFIAEHVPLEDLYSLHLDEEDYDPYWSPYSICGTFAEKRGYTIQGGGPDFHRAGLEILRDVVDGYVLLAFRPPSDLDGQSLKQAGSSSPKFVGSASAVLECPARHIKAESEEEDNDDGEESFDQDELATSEPSANAFADLSE